MKGLYLASPHGRLIAEGEKSAIARPVADIDEKERLIVSKENGQGLAFGVARLSEAEEVNTKEFDERFNEHKVSVTERARWWAEKDTLYLYKIDKFQAFDEAKEVQVVPGTKMSMGEVQLEKPILNLSVADTKEKAFRGFQSRKSIALDEGILFPLFPNDETISIWMKDTLVPLTVAFLNSDCKVLALEKLEPLSEKVVGGPEGTEWALEASPEWFESFDITVGSQLMMGYGGVKEVLTGDEGNTSMEKLKSFYVTIDESGKPGLDIEADSWEEAQAKLDQGKVVGRMVYEVEVGPSELKAELKETDEKLIRHEDDKWVLYTKDGSRKLGEFDTEEEAQERERQIEFFKTERAKDESEKAKVDITENSIRVRVIDPGEFQKESFRTITIDEDRGIQAVIARPKGKDTTKVQTFIFDKEKWTPAKAQQWVEERESRKELAESLAEKLVVLHRTEEKVWYGIPLD